MRKYLYLLSLGVSLLSMGCSQEHNNGNNDNNGKNGSNQPQEESSCQTGWAGADCKECAVGFYGAECQACPDCGEHGTCLSGLTGSGECSCAEGWAGADCKECAASFYGANCAACPDCGDHGSCAEGLTGSGECVCENNWTGSSCDECATGFYGAECQACPDCGAHGTCLSGLTGSGECSCAEGWAGSGCAECAAGFYGPECAPCSCEHGTCADGLTDSGECSCDEGWAGTDCEECAAGFYGPECAACPDCGEHGTCADGLTESGECICDDGWIDSDCSKCDYTIAYGVECTLYDSMTDLAGKSYKTAVIDGTTWMAENMGYVTGTYYYPDGNSDNVADYGLLYNWKTAATVCPTGWRMPTRSEYNQLISYTGGEEDSSALRSTAWANGTNTSGFNGIPAGDRFRTGAYDNFNVIGNYWSSTKDGIGNAYSINVNNTNAFVGYSDLSTGFSVRCLKEAD